VLPPADKNMKRILIESFIIASLLFGCLFILNNWTENRERETATRLTADRKIAEDCTIVMKTDIGLYCRGMRSGKLFFVAN
jgi:hypothetical protein